MNQAQLPKTLWKPEKEFFENSNLKKYLDWLKKEKQLYFEDYASLWQWSVDNLTDFWESIWQFFDITSHAPYKEVCSKLDMPGVKWFTGAQINYAEHIFKNKSEKHPAIVFQSETQELVEISWSELEGQVASMQDYLKYIGLKKGDSVAAYLPNIPEATMAFLATCSIGAVWSSCSPDFGLNSVLDRFKQIKPKVLFATDGYSYNGKQYDKTEMVKALCEALPTLEKVIFVPYLDKEAYGSEIPNSIRWVETFSATAAQKIEFTPVEFNDPIWVLYSSGTTGVPKAITHSQGGVLLEHYKYVSLHNNIKPGERFFWFSTTGWMMWNFVQASMLGGATIVLYDGSPGYPSLDVMWELAEKAKINHFGTSAPFLVANMKAGMEPGKSFDLKSLISIGSTGSPLPPAAFDYVYKHIGKDIWLCSMAGGTDVCTAWVGGNPMLPVYEGEIQSRSLGAALFALDEAGNKLVDKVGEMVVTKPMPSMPIYFWGDEGNKRYKASYFEMYEGWWRHGDWVKITERGTVVIMGRSDATLNRGGVRIGTAEIYRALDKVSEIKDSVIVSLELEGGKDYMPLFLVLKDEQTLSPELQKRIKSTLRSEYSPRHVPDEMIIVKELPYTISGKKLESPIKKILMGVPIEKAATKDSLKNPESLKFFLDFYAEKFKS